MKKCNECGYLYKRAECEFCQRLHRWNNQLEGNWMTKHGLSARLQRDLTRLGNFYDGRILQSTLITGASGTGKTVLAARMLVNQMRHHYVSNSLHPWRYVFASTPELLMEIRRCIDDPEQTEYAVIDRYRTADYLVLDDLGVEKVTEWVAQLFYLIINYRYEHLLPTVVTTNYSIKELNECGIDERVTHRIQRSYQLIEKTKNWK